MPGFNASPPIAVHQKLPFANWQIRWLMNSLWVFMCMYVGTHVRSYMSEIRSLQTEEGVKVRDLCKCMCKLSDSLSMIYFVKLTLTWDARLDIPKSEGVK